MCTTKIILNFHNKESKGTKVSSFCFLVRFSVHSFSPGKGNPIRLTNYCVSQPNGKNSAIIPSAPNLTQMTIYSGKLLIDGKSFRASKCFALTFRFQRNLRSGTLLKVITNICYFVLSNLLAN